MKKNRYIIILLLLINFLNAQEQIVDYCYEPLSLNDFENKYFKDTDNDFAPFIGTWKFVENNKTFIVTLWKEQHVSFNGVFTGLYKDQIFGDWKMIENEGMLNENILYNSYHYVGNGQYFPPTISGGGSCDGIHFSSLIMDNCIDNGFIKNGILKFTITSSNTAHWYIKSLNGMQIENAPNFMIPTDIILTKQ
jgi:hypothetical protein